MVCQGCGAPVVDGVHFCSRCGAQVVAAQPMYAAYPQPPVPTVVPRVQRNLQTLGILWCVFGAYRVISGLMGMFFLKVFAFHSFAYDWPFNHQHVFGQPWTGALLPIVAAYTVVTAGLAVFVGYSLLTRRPWGRTFAIIVAVLTLLKPLFGTALGIYTLWVLAPSTSGLEYDAIADRS
ncbi:zinc ribbon domain-containing protein [Tunturiibacter lichenicola]|uniref:zinc ribbon domain-containing protein n=1 Tax=Tunturiibacter lichenicola TaxID=2051959 RepID=UPI003D9B81A9